MEIMKTLTIGGETYEIADMRMREALENGGVIVAVVTSTDPVTGRVTHTCTLSNGETFTVGDGASGVYIGSGTPPTNATVWINPVGEPTATEDWEFDLDDGSTDTKTVVVIGSDDAVNQGKVAILRMKDADGKWVEIPAIKGVSPVVKTSKSGKVTTITITDADGDKTVTLNDGVDITKVEQTTTSTEDGGSNVMTVTLSNGNKSTFTVKNGSKGRKGDTGTSVAVEKVTESTEDGGSNVVNFSDGKSVTVKNGKTGGKGDPGKSAYQYAKDGGYTGTEAEFMAKLAADIPTRSVVIKPTDQSVISYFKISNFGTWHGLATNEKVSLLIGARSGETILFTLAGENATTMGASALRLNDRYSKISGIYYKISENAIYVSLAAWGNILTVDVLSDKSGNYTPIVEQISALPTDATDAAVDAKLISVPIIPFGSHYATGVVVGNTAQNLALGGKNTRPTYNGNDIALYSDIPTDIVPITVTSTDGVAYTATAPYITATSLAELKGAKLVIIPNMTSTNAYNVTLNVNGLGAQLIKRWDNTDTSEFWSFSKPSWFKEGYPVTVTFNGKYWMIEGMNKPYASDLSGTVAIANGGTGVTSHADTTYTTARYRASALMGAETDPTVNGVINWTYG